MNNETSGRHVMPSENRLRLTFIDSVRGLAALSVCLFHFSNGNPQLLPSDDYVKIIGSYGWAGVEVFFVISGFVLPWSLWEGARLGQFVARRALRIYPPFLASIILVTTLQFVSMITPGYRGDGIFHGTSATTLAHLIFACDFLGYEWYIPVYWTLAIEMQFYLVLAILFYLARQTSMHLLCITFAALPLLDLGQSFVNHYAAMFNFGIVLCLYKRQAINLLQTIIHLSISSGIVLFINGWIQVAAYITTVCLFAIAFERPRFLNNKYLQGLGTISYSLYLVHVPVGGRIINLAERLTDQHALRYLAILLALAVSIAFAAVFFSLIEGPSLLLLKRPPRPKPTTSIVS